MTEDSSKYAVIHDNELAEKIYTISNAGYFQFRIHPPSKEYPTIHGASFDVKVHADGRVEIANLPQAFKIMVVPL